MNVYKYTLINENMKKIKIKPVNVNLDDIMREQTGQTPQKDKTYVRSVKKLQDNNEYRRCSFICSPELWEKAQAIAHKERFSVRNVMEHWMQAGIASYEGKNGKIKLKKGRAIDDVM